MNYTVKKLDGRFSHYHYFKYYIGFPHRMSNKSGPLNFVKAQKWFTETYGWSAEIRQWNEIRDWIQLSKKPLLSVKQGWVRAQPDSDDIPEECNQLWSWSNLYEDLRIYVASSKELAFFQLKFSADS